MSRPRLLIAGIGNIFLGDDGFGVEVAQRLQQQESLPSEAQVVDFGIRGIDLTYALLDGYEFVILLDASRQGGPPGSLYVIEPEVQELLEAEAQEPAVPEELLIQAHDLDPARVLRVARSLGSLIQRVLVVACEPDPGQAQRGDLLGGLSAAVRRSVDEAARMAERLAVQLLADERPKVSGT